MSSRQENTTRQARSRTREPADDHREPSRSGSQPSKEPDTPQEKATQKPSRLVLQKQIRAIEDRLEQYDEQLKAVSQRLETVEQRTQPPAPAQSKSEEAPPTPTTAAPPRKPKKLNTTSSGASQASKQLVTATKPDTSEEPAADNTHHTNDAKPKPPKLNRSTPAAAAKSTQSTSAAAQPAGVKKPLNETRDPNQKSTLKKSRDASPSAQSYEQTTMVTSKPGDEDEENKADVAARSVIQAARAVKGAVGDTPTSKPSPKPTSAIVKRSTSIAKPATFKEDPIEVVPRVQEPQFDSKPNQVTGNYNPATGEYEITLKSNMAQSGELITRAIQKGVGLAGRFSGDLIQGRAKHGIAGAGAGMIAFCNSVAKSSHADQPVRSREAQRRSRLGRCSIEVRRYLSGPVHRPTRRIQEPRGLEVSDGRQRPVESLRIGNK